MYCGAEDDITADHVPPKLLLGKPYPKNLITVPACKTCNQSFQKDDEYTRTMLCLDARAFGNIAARSKLSAVLRSLQRPQARSFVKYLTSQKTFGQIQDVDKVRLNKTGQRLIRALYFSETGTPLPVTAVIRVGAKTDLRPEDRDTQVIARAFNKFTDQRESSVGTAFSYLAGVAPGCSVWLMQLDDYFFWLGTVDVRGCEKIKFE